MKTLRILVYPDIAGDIYWLAETEEQLSAALTQLFQLLDEQGHYMEVRSDAIYIAAKSGDFDCVKQVLEHGKHCEYPGWKFASIVDPT